VATHATEELQWILREAALGGAALTTSACATTREWACQRTPEERAGGPRTQGAAPTKHIDDGRRSICMAGSFLHRPNGTPGNLVRLLGQCPGLRAGTWLLSCCRLSQPHSSERHFEPSLTSESSRKSSSILLQTSADATSRGWIG
jgi:hypothetical protein